MSAHLAEVWRPLYVGALTGGLLLGALGYVLVQVLWRRSIVARWRRRAALAAA